ncbi:MAG TPA: hypothetical protein VKB57_08090 [Acidimicrobiales bacterium]|nr:hypothetical protein [Acidimicrobiales bacterium]
MTAAPADEVRAVFGTGAGPVALESLGHAVVASATVGLWRARDGDRTAIVKVLAPAPEATGFWRPGTAVDHWYWWRREADAFASGLLPTLAGGLRAPACRLVAVRDDGSVALWLEDLAGTPGPVWRLTRYRAAARHLGAAQGEFVAGRALPDEPWLSRGWLADYLAGRAGDGEAAADADAWRHPLVAACFPDPPVEAAAALWADRGRALAALDALPQTLTHHDLHPANLFDAAGETAVIDWAFVGRAGMGEDAGALVAEAVLDFYVPAADLDALHEAVAAGYHEGLRAAGVAVDAERVRAAMAAGVAAKFAWVPGALVRAAAEGREQLNRRPLAEAIGVWAAVVRWLLAQRSG